ncbi:MAG: hypothetical protein WC438_02095 [Candidatus Pacearchaeota archaeon]
MYIGIKKREREFKEQNYRCKLPLLEIYLFRNPRIASSDNGIAVIHLDDPLKDYKQFELFNGDLIERTKGGLGGIGIERDCLFEINGNLKELSEKHKIPMFCLEKVANSFREPAGNASN